MLGKSCVLSKILLDRNGLNFSFPCKQSITYIPKYFWRYERWKCHQSRTNFFWFRQCHKQREKICSEFTGIHSHNKTCNAIYNILYSALTYSHNQIFEYTTHCLDECIHVSNCIHSRSYDTIYTTDCVSLYSWMCKQFPYITVGSADVQCQ